MVEVLVSSVCLVIVSTAVASAVQFTASQGREQRIRAFLVGELKSMSRQVQSEAQRGRFPVSSNVVLTSPEWGQYRVANVVTVDPSDPHRFANNIQVNLVNNPTKSVFLRTVVRAADVFTITAIPWTTFGIEQDGTGRMPTVIRLSEYGIRPGDRLRMLAVGGHSHHNPPIATSVGRMAVIAFTADMVLSATTNVRDRIGEVLEPLEAPGMDGAWSTTWFPEGSFLLPDSTVTPVPVDVTVPDNAEYMWISAMDSWYSDNINSATDPWGVEVLRLPPIPDLNTELPVLADSIRDFGMQGENGWVYGYIPGQNAATVNWRDFVPALPTLTVANNLGYTVDGRLPNVNDPARDSAFWLIIWAQFMHPQGGGGRTPAVHMCAVRRWVAPRFLPRLEITYWAFHSQTGSGFGDGMDFVVARGDAVLANHSIVSGGGRVDNTLVLTNVQPGEVIDFRFGPRADAGTDHGNMRATLVVR